MTITQASAMHMLHEGVRQLQMYARPHANRCGASMTSSLLNSRIRRGNACFLRFSSLEVHAPHTEATRARTKLREAADALFGSQGSTRRRSWAAREVGRLSSELFTAEYGASLVHALQQSYAQSDPAGLRESLAIAIARLAPLLEPAAAAEATDTIAAMLPLESAPTVRALGEFGVHALVYLDAIAAKLSSESVPERQAAIRSIFALGELVPARSAEALAGLVRCVRLQQSGAQEMMGRSSLRATELVFLPIAGPATRHLRCACDRHEVKGNTLIYGVAALTKLAETNSEALPHMTSVLELHDCAEVQVKRYVNASVQLIGKHRLLACDSILKAVNEDETIAEYLDSLCVTNPDVEHSQLWELPKLRKL